MNRSTLFLGAALLFLGGYVAVSILTGESGKPAGAPGSAAAGQAAKEPPLVIPESPAPRSRAAKPVAQEAAPARPDRGEDVRSRPPRAPGRKAKREAGRVDPAWRAVLEQARRRIAAGEIGRTLADLGRRYRRSPHAGARACWRGPLLAWAKEHLLSPSTASGLYRSYVIAGGDTLIRIADRTEAARKILVAPGFLQEVNRIAKPHLIRAGDRLWVPVASPSLEVRLGEFRLDHYLGDCLLASYPVGIGKDGRTPRAEFTVSAKLVEPEWFFEGQVIPYGDPRNELGERWIGFRNETFKGFGIHGTNDEASIGHAVSRGCIRMRNADVIELFNRIPKRTPVKIRS